MKISNFRPLRPTNLTLRGIVTVTTRRWWIFKKSVDREIRRDYADVFWYLADTGEQIPGWDKS